MGRRVSHEPLNLVRGRVRCGVDLGALFVAIRRTVQADHLTIHRGGNDGFAELGNSSDPWHAVRNETCAVSEVWASSSKVASSGAPEMPGSSKFAMRFPAFDFKRNDRSSCSWHTDTPSKRRERAMQAICAFAHTTARSDPHRLYVKLNKVPVDQL